VYSTDVGIVVAFRATSVNLSYLSSVLCWTLQTIGLDMVDIYMVDS